MPSERQVWATVAWLLLAAAVPLLYLYVDRPLALAMRTLDPAAVALARAVTDFGKSEWPLVPSALLALYALWRRRGAVRSALRRGYGWLAAAASFVCLSVALSGIAVNIVKFLAGRARPKLLGEPGIYGFHPFAGDADFQSFPSGHATSAMAAAFALAFLMPRWRWRILALGAALSLTRLVVGAHFLGDILAGGLLAFATAALLRAAFLARGWGFVRGAAGRPMPRRHARRLAAGLLRTDLRRLAGTVAPMRRERQR